MGRHNWHFVCWMHTGFYETMLTLVLTQPPIIQQGDNREQETKMETAVKHAVVLCGPHLPNICFSPVNVWFGPAAPPTHLLLAVLLPEAAISGLLWASFRWRFKRKKIKLCHCRQKRMSRVVQRPLLPESPGANTRNILHHMQELQDNRKQSDFI